MSQKSSAASPGRCKGEPDQEGERPGGFQAAVATGPAPTEEGYVIEGSYEFAINGQPGRVLKAGDTFYEPPDAVHTTSRNPSPNARAKVLVFMVADQKNPSTIPE